MTVGKIGFVAAALAGAALYASAASAAPLMASGIAAGKVVSGDSMIVQVQRRGGNFRAGAGGGAGRRVVAPRAGGFRGGGGRGVAVRRGGRGIGGAGAAAIGLGVLGAAIAAGAASSAPPAECWVERRAVRDDWGNFIGYRNVRICN